MRKKTIILTSSLVFLAKYSTILAENNQPRFTNALPGLFKLSAECIHLATR